MAAKKTRITTELQPDAPVVQDATYRFDKQERNFVDEQIRGCQQHLADSLINGMICSWVKTDSALEPGDVVVLRATSVGAVVTLATESTLPDAGRAFGVAVVAASANTVARFAVGGIVPPGVTGLSVGARGHVRVNGHRLERVESYLAGDYPVGDVDPQGFLTMSPERAYEGVANFTAIATACANATAPLVMKSPWPYTADIVNTAALRLGADPGGTGQVRATDGIIVSAKAAGGDRTLLSTQGNITKVGGGHGAVVEVPADTSFWSVTDGDGDRIVSAHDATTFSRLVNLYGGGANSALAKGDVGQDGFGRITGRIGGVEKKALYEGDVDGGAVGVLHSGTGQPNSTRVVQGRSSAGLAVTSPAPVTAGDLLVVLLQCEANIAGATVSDTLGTTYRMVGESTSHPLNAQVWVGLAGATGTATITGTHPTSWARTTFAAYRGVTASVESTDAVYGGVGPLTVVAGEAGALIVGAVASYYSGVAYTPASGFEVDATAGDSDSSLLAHHVATTAGAVSVTYGTNFPNDAPFFAVAIAPSAVSSVGVDGDWYLNLADKSLWGPRTNGVYQRVGALS
jgi:hypothetical protein